MIQVILLSFIVGLSNEIYAKVNNVRKPSLFKKRMDRKYNDARYGLHFPNGNEKPHQDRKLQSPSCSCRNEKLFNAEYEKIDVGNGFDESNETFWKPLSKKEIPVLVNKIQQLVRNSEYLLYCYRTHSGLIEIKIEAPEAKRIISQYFELSEDVQYHIEQSPPQFGLYVLSMFGYRNSASKETVYFLNTTLWTTVDTGNAISTQVDKEIIFYDSGSATSYRFELSDKFYDFMQYYFSDIVNKHGGFRDQQLKPIGKEVLLARPIWIKKSISPLACPCANCHPPKVDRLPENADRNVKSGREMSGE